MLSHAEVRTAVTSLLVLFLGYYGSALQAAPIDDVLNNLQPGEWYAVPNSRLETTFPTPIPEGNSGPESVMDAWSGGAYDTKRDRLIVWGGGHADYSGNEIYVFDVNSLQWSRLTEPSSNVGGNEATGLYPDGKPRSAHTNNYIQYAESVDRFISLGLGFTYPQSYVSPYVHAFNFDTLTWDSTLQPVPSDAGSIPDSITAYDPKTGKIWRQGGRNGDFRSYDPVTDTWSRGYGGWTYIEFYNTAAIDPNRRLMVSTGPDNSVLTWNLDSPGNPVAVNTSGDKSIESAQAPGFVFDPVSDKFVAWNGGASVYVLDPDTWMWTKISPAPTNKIVPSSPNTRGTFGRFRYIPSKNAFILVNRTNENVYIYKLTNGAGQPRPVISMNASPEQVDLGGSSNLSWLTTNATACAASGAWTGAKAVSTNNQPVVETVGPINDTSTYVLECSGPGGSSISSIMVTVNSSSGGNPPPNTPPPSDNPPADDSGNTSVQVVGSDVGGVGSVDFFYLLAILGAWFSQLHGSRRKSP